jgi:predicted ATP-dependent serine protease
MRASNLIRSKWDEKRGSQTYGERTITSAMANVKEISSTPITRIKVVKASEMTNEIVNWMWKNRIVSGALNLFSGEPGSGKGTLCAYIAARVSTGSDF